MSVRAPYTWAMNKTEEAGMETMSTGARYLERGDTFDPEDHRMTHRLRIARSILSGQGIEPTWEHGTGPDTEVCEFGRIRHSCNYKCTAVWPEWVGTETFNAAFALADAIQDERGGYHRAQAAAAKATRKDG